MDENEQNRSHVYYIILSIFTAFSILLFLIYLSLVLYYITKNYKNKKLCNFWVDYCLLLFGSILFNFIYILYLLVFNEDEQERNRMKNPTVLSTNFFPPAVVISLSFLCFTLIATLIFDTITAIRISSKMNKMKSIKEMDLIILSERLNSIDYVDILKMKSHHIYNLVFVIINLVLIIIEILAYVDINPIRFDTVWRLQYFFDYLLRFYHFIVLACLIISIIIMIHSKKALLGVNYYNSNRIAQNVYDAHFGQIIYFTDVINFKLVADLLMNIPPLLFMSTGKFNSFTLIISEIAIFLYIFLGGSEYFVIDKHSKAGKTNKYIRRFFCLKQLDFHFGEKDVKNIFDEFKFDYNQEEKNILNNLNIKIIQTDEYNLSKEENELSFSSSNIELQNTN